MSASPDAPLWGLLLSGGASRRMGRDKALIEYQGEAQLLRAWRLLKSVCERSFLSLRADQRGDPVRDALPQIPDRYEAAGPMVGILSAQESFPHAAWLVVACDLPLLDEATLGALVAARDPSADAVAFSSRFDGLPEPLCAIWEPSSYRDLKRNHGESRYCPRRSLRDLHTILLPTPGDALDNINTPAEFEQITRQLEPNA